MLLRPGEAVPGHRVPHHGGFSPGRDGQGMASPCAHSATGLAWVLPLPRGTQPGEVTGSSLGMSLKLDKGYGAVRRLCS